MNQWIFSICNFSFKQTLSIFSDIKISGKENIPLNGPVIIVSNHISNIDPAIVAASITRRPNFLAKKELFNNFFLNNFLRSYGAYPVDRGKGDIGALRWGEKQLKKGNALILFPEGTRSKSGKLMKGKSGVVKLAAITGSPIIPMGISGSENLQNLLKVLVPISKLRIKIGSSFFVKKENFLNKNDYEEATKEIMIKIAMQLPNKYHGDYQVDENLKFSYIN